MPATLLKTQDENENNVMLTIVSSQLSYGVIDSEKLLNALTSKRFKRKCIKVTDGTEMHMLNLLMDRVSKIRGLKISNL